jgi:RNA polymerase sigma factor (sigma-70 family)
MTEKKVSGEAAWIGELVDRYEAPLARYVRRLVGCPDRARDIVQEAFMALSRESPGRLNGHAAQWLYTVCRRRAMDVRRKESRMVSENEQAVMDRVALGPGPEGIVGEREEMGRVEQLVTELPDAQQEMVRLKFGGGLSYKEIAEVTGLSVSNVGFLLHTAIATLRKQMDPDAKRQGNMR